MRSQEILLEFEERQEKSGILFSQMNSVMPNCRTISMSKFICQFEMQTYSLECRHAIRTFKT